MKLEGKQAIVEDLGRKLREAKTVIFADFTGLNVKNMTALRRRFREAGVEFVVVKNTLAQRALDGFELEVPDVAQHLTGPTGLVIERDASLVAPKILDEFARAHDNRPKVKVGLVEWREYSAAEVGRLAKLPGRDELLAELAGAMQAPLAQLVGVLGAKLTEMAGLIEALREERARG